VGAGRCALSPSGSPYSADLHREPFTRGVSEFAGFYGMMLGSLGYAYLNGFA